MVLSTSEKRQTAALTLLIALSILLQGGFFYYTCIPAVLVSALWLLVRRRESCYTLTPAACAALACFFAALVLSIIFNRLNVQTGIDELFKYLIFAAALFIAVTIENRFVVFYSLVFGGTALAAGGLLAYFKLLNLPDYAVYEGNIRVVQSFLQYSNTTAAFLGICFIISLCLIFRSGKPWALTALSSLILTAMLLTVSKGAVALLVPAVLILIIIKPETALFTAVQCAFCLALALLAYFGVAAKQSLLALLCAAVIIPFAAKYISRLSAVRLPRTLSRAAAITGIALFAVAGAALLYTGRYSGTLYQRLIYSGDAARAFAASPLLGIGPGAWETRQFSLASAQYYVKYIHNGPLQIFLDAGIFAGVPFVYIIGAAVIRYIKSRSENGLGDELFTLFALGYLLLHSVIDMNMSFGCIMIALALLLAGGLRRERAVPVSGGRKRLSPRLPAVIASALMICFSLYISGGYLSVTAYNSYAAADDGDGMRRAADSLCFFRSLDSDTALISAYCSREFGSRDEAADSFLRAKELSPFDRRAVAALIEEYRGDDAEKTFEYCDEYISLAPKQQSSYTYVSQIYSGMQESNLITEAEYNERIKLLCDKAAEANSTMNILARYTGEDIITIKE